MKEVWKAIQKYEGRYEVSDKGRIRAIVRRMKYLRPRDNGKGYLYVDLYADGTRVRRFYIHRLVALTFLSGHRIGLEINHKDGDKANNILENLCFMSHSDNLKHAYNTGLHSGPRPVNKRKVKVKGTRKVFDSITAAAHAIGIAPCGINNALNRRQKTAKGREWVYA